MDNKQRETHRENYGYDSVPKCEPPIRVETVYGNFLVGTVRLDNFRTPLVQPAFALALALSFVVKRAET